METKKTLTNEQKIEALTTEKEKLEKEDALLAIEEKELEEKISKLRNKLPQPQKYSPETKDLKVKSKEATKKLLADEKKKEEEEAEAEKVRNKNQSGATDKERTEIASDFKSDYGIDPFAQIPGFADMTPGQWKLIYQNLAQIKLDYVETESQHAFAKRVQDAGANSGSMLGKISGYAKIAGLNLNKGYILNEERKKAKANLDSGGMQVYGKSLNALVDSIKKTGLGVSLDASMDQEYRIEYAGGLENLTKEEKEIIEEFNRAATEFGQIPKEWSFERGEIQKTLTGDWGTRKNKENFETFKARYEEEKKNLVEILRNKFGNDENKVFQYLGQIDNNVLFNQMINTDPKAIKALEDIENSKSWMKVLYQ